MPATFTLGPGYPLRFFKGGLGFVFSSKWVGEEDPVICSGEGVGQFYFFHIRQTWPVNDHWLCTGGFLSPDSFRSSSCVLEEGGGSEGCISLVLCGVEYNFLMPEAISRRRICVVYPCLVLAVE